MSRTKTLYFGHTEDSKGSRLTWNRKCKHNLNSKVSPKHNQQHLISRKTVRVDRKIWM